MSEFSMDAILRADDGRFVESEEPTPEVNLQRVVVRMLFDPDFARSVRADPERATRGLDIPSRLLKQLKEQDVRLWWADDLRPLRAMKGLVQEFQVSTALYLNESRSWSALMSFFGDASFHSSVQNRQYMALAFMEYLRAQINSGEGYARARATLQLEGAMAVLRRVRKEAFRRPQSVADQLIGGGLLLTPSAQVASIPAGTLSVIQRVEKFLFEAESLPVLSLVTDGPRLQDLPPVDPDRQERYLLECDEASQVSMSTLTHEYAQVLGAFRTPCHLEGHQLPGRAQLDASRALELAHAVREAGLLIADWPAN